VTWAGRGLSATFYVTRDGGTPNFLATSDPTGYAQPGAGTLRPWTRANVSAQYEVTAQLRLAASITNLFNAMPPPDHSYDGIYTGPYNAANYNVIGRGLRLEARYRPAR